MNDNKRNIPDCHPAPSNPAAQPKPPGHCECPEEKLPEPPAPKAPPAPPATSCTCPRTPPVRPDCLQKLINKQNKETSKIDKLKQYTADLTAFETKAQAAKLDYTHAKYESLVKQWVAEDDDIVDLLRKLVCAVPCWKCVVECYICPLIYDVRRAEYELYGDGTEYNTVNNLYDLQYWWTRERDKRARRLARVQAVLSIWEKPAVTIAKALTDNQTLIASLNKSLLTDPGKAIYDVFFTLIPRHLAVAPPQGSAWTTRIPADYTNLCGCAQPKPDDCCGPNVGPLSVCERLLGPLPYLLPPHEFFKMICCLVEKRFEPAKDALTDAETELVQIGKEIAADLAAIADAGVKAIEAAAKAAIPASLSCCGEQLEDETATSQSRT